MAPVQRSAGAVKAESLGRALMNAQIEGRFQRQTGNLLILSFIGFDPFRTSACPASRFFAPSRRDPQSQAGRTICTSIQNNSVLPQGRRLGVLAQSNPSKSGGVRLEAAFKPRGADHVYTPEASDPL